MIVFENEIEVKADKNMLNGVIEFIEQALDENGVSPKIQMQLTIAAEEIFVNIASYAYTSNDGTAIVKLKIENEPNLVTMIFIDKGVQFNPLEKADPDVTLSAEERGIGGLGIYMTKKSMDNMKYKYMDGENYLLIEKSY